MRIHALISFVLFCLVAMPGMAEELTEDELYGKFLDYTMKTYTKVTVDRGLSFSDFHTLYAGQTTMTSSRVLGYSLGNLLKFFRRGDANHKIWLILEAKLKQDIEKTIESEGQMRGWDRDYIEKRKKRSWQECMAAQQGWYNAMLIVDTRVSPKEAPNFFATLSEPTIIAGNADSPAGDTGSLVDTTTGSKPDPNVRDTNQENESDPGTGEESDTPYHTVADEILGLWTYTHEQEIHGRIIRQKLVIEIQRAGTEEYQTATGSMPKYLYEGYVVEIQEITDEWSRPYAAVGELIWKLEYTKTRREPSERFLGYSLDVLKDRYAAFGIRLLRQEGILEVGQAKYYRGTNR